MKQKIYILFVLALLAVSCGDDNTTTPISLEKDVISMEAVGGVEKIKVTASDKWIASTDNPWITISPANGIGSSVCEFKIDSALTVEPRRGVVRIQNLATWDEQEIVVEQKGFPYSIEVDNASIDISNYDEYNKRYFDVTINSNVEFSVDIPDNAESWLSYDSYEIKLDRGVRPRKVKVHFKWDINSSPVERLAEVRFYPRKSVEMSRSDVLNVKQGAADPIIPDSRAGDSVALLCISRSLRTLSSWDASTPMDMWNNVVLWDEGMEGCTPEKVGRVKRAAFMLFNTVEKLPFEVKYLTAADELYFFGNTNTFMEVGRILSTHQTIHRNISSIQADN